MEQRIRLHPVLLARPFAKALALSLAGGVIASLGWPATPGGVALLALGAAVATGAVWRWERTYLVVGGERLSIVHGTLRRRSASVRMGGAVELEQSLVGRVLGYGTIVAGELEIQYVAQPRRLLRLSH
jgi:hypothetical protein